MTQVGSGVEYWILQLIDLCLGFLDSNKIGALFCEPLKKTFARSRTYAVCINRYHSHKTSTLPETTIIQKNSRYDT